MPLPESHKSTLKKRGMTPALPAPGRPYSPLATGSAERLDLPGPSVHTSLSTNFDDGTAFLLERLSDQDGGQHTPKPSSMVSDPTYYSSRSRSPSPSLSSPLLSPEPLLPASFNYQNTTISSSSSSFYARLLSSKLPKPLFRFLHTFSTLLASLLSTLHDASPDGSRFIRSSLSRFLQTVLATTVVVTALLLLKLLGAYPSSSATIAQREDHVWFTDKFQYRVPESFGRDEIAVWNPVGNATAAGLGESDAEELSLITEFHTHTNYSDGTMTPAQVVDWAIAYGFHILFVTDHNTVEGGIAAREYALTHRPGEILVVPGIEYSCCRIHMNLVAMDLNTTTNSTTGEPQYLQDMAELVPTEAFPTDTQLQAAINKTHALNGLVFVNHFPWSLSSEDSRQVPTLQRHPSIPQLLAWDVDGFESVNAGVLDLPTIRASEEHGMPYLTATDLHWPQVAPNAWTVVRLEASEVPAAYRRRPSESVQHSPAELLAASLIFQRRLVSALKTRETDPALKRTNFYYSPIGPSSTTRSVLGSTPGSTPGPSINHVYPPPDPLLHDLLKPLEALDFTYFWSQNTGMYSFVDGFCHKQVFTFHYWRAAAFVGWALVAFLVMEGVRFVVLTGINLFRQTTLKQVDASYIMEV